MQLIHAIYQSCRLNDPTEKELDPNGSGFKNTPPENYTDMVKNFITGCNELVDYGAKFGINLLVENNVCTKSNFNRHGSSPFMFSGYKESIEFVNTLPKECGVLLDIGHLNVSSTTMNYNGNNLIHEIKDRINAFHLSHNNGLMDSNNPLEDKTTYLKYVQQISCEYLTLEVYDYSPSVLQNCIKLASQS